MGNRNLRKLLVVGVHSVLFHRKLHTDPLRMWAKKLIEKKPFKLGAVALANKMARTAFTTIRHKTTYREMPAYAVRRSSRRARQEPRQHRNRGWPRGDAQESGLILKPVKRTAPVRRDAMN
jgi:hypothetical protein